MAAAPIGTVGPRAEPLASGTETVGYGTNAALIGRALIAIDSFQSAADSYINDQTVTVGDGRIFDSYTRRKRWTDIKPDSSPTHEVAMKLILELYAVLQRRNTIGGLMMDATLEFLPMYNPVIVTTLRELPRTVPAPKLHLDLLPQVKGPLHLLALLYQRTIHEEVHWQRDHDFKARFSTRSSQEPSKTVSNRKELMLHIVDSVHLLFELRSCYESRTLTPRELALTVTPLSIKSDSTYTELEAVFEEEELFQAYCKEKSGLLRDIFDLAGTIMRMYDSHREYCNVANCDPVELVTKHKDVAVRYERDKAAAVAFPATFHQLYDLATKMLKPAMEAHRMCRSKRSLTWEPLDELTFADKMVNRAKIITLGNTTYIKYS